MSAFVFAVFQDFVIYFVRTTIWIYQVYGSLQSQLLFIADVSESRKVFICWFSHRILKPRQYSEVTLILTLFILKLWIYENHICELQSEESFEGRSSQLHMQPMQLRKESLKKELRLVRDSNPVTATYRCSALPINCDDLPSNNYVKMTAPAMVDTSRYSQVTLVSGCPFWQLSIDYNMDVHNW